MQADLYGSSRSLLRLVSGLDPQAYRIVIAVSGDGPLRRQLEASGAKVIDVPHIGAVGRWNLLSWRAPLIPLELAVATRRLLRIIRREGIELVHSNTSIILAAALAAKLAGVPHVFHVREIYEEFPVIWRLHRRFICWSSREVVCISAAVARQFAPRAVQVVRNGLDAGAESRMATAAAPPTGIRAPGADAVIGCIGRIKLCRKGQEVLLRAMALLQERGIHARALIVGLPFVGNESHLDALRSLARRLGVSERVEFLGEQPDVWPLYARMDVFVMPSVLPEPLGNVILEAMAMGLPVVASRNGGVPELVEDGKSGLLFAPGDAAELADRLADLLLHPDRRREMGEAGRRRQRNEFSLARCVGGLEAVYRRALTARGREAAAAT
jgi:glycosyltransferase involved in cell wall biosynthesis